jgi:peptidyl-prolyl cis-trans isomerase A (cyclophilin A)
MTQPGKAYAMTNTETNAHDVRNQSIRARRPFAAAAMLGSAFMLLASGSAGFCQTGNLTNPAALNEKAPAAYKVRFDTERGPVIVDVRRDWAPNGADRFYNLVKNGFYDNARFFRVVSGFMVQFGIHGDPKISAVWRTAAIKDDPVRQSNKRGFITYATSGPNSRTTQVFINFGDNAALDSQGFAPFGQVSSGMEKVDAMFAGYGEGAPQGRGPDQGRIQREGNAYLMKDFPKLDFIKKATLEK